MNTFKNVFNKYKTDKSSCHNYHVPYHENLDKYKDKEINLLEIGIRDCCSLRSWKELFPKAHIYGMDISPECKLFENEGFKIVIGDQNKIEDLNSFGNIQFDVIIDDGSHFNKHIIKSFKHLFFKNLKPGGIYFIEDLGCSYIKDYGKTTNEMLNPKGQKLNTEIYNNRKDIIDFFENIHINMDLNNWPKNREGYNPDGPCKKHYNKIIYYTDMAVIYKN